MAEDMRRCMVCQRAPVRHTVRLHTVDATLEFDYCDWPCRDSHFPRDKQGRLLLRRLGAAMAAARWLPARARAAR